METMDFDRVAAAWARWWPTFERGAGTVSERMISLAALAPGEDVLDLATGLGEPALAAARAVGSHGRVTGIDISPAMVALARERAGREGVTNVEYVQADASAFGAEQTFDAILSRWGLMFLPDLDAPLRHYRDRLRAGGRFVAAVWGPPPEVPLISLPMQVARQRFGGEAPPVAGGPFALHDTARLERSFRDAGYREVAVEGISADFPFRSAAEYFEHVCDVAPPVRMLLQALDEAAREQLRLDVERAVAERFSAPGGDVRLANRVYIITARV